MSTTLAAPDTAGSSAAVSPGDAVPQRAVVRRQPAARAEPRVRGQLVLTERVVEKIAAQAAVEAGATSGRTSRALGLGDPDPDARPAVQVDLSAESADLALKVAVAYPGSIRTATQQVREHVTARVEQLTGVDVRRVDIDVTLLRTDADDQPKVLR